MMLGSWRCIHLCGNWLVGTICRCRSQHGGGGGGGCRCPVVAVAANEVTPSVGANNMTQSSGIGLNMVREFTTCLDGQQQNRPLPSSHNDVMAAAIVPGIAAPDAEVALLF